MDILAIRKRRMLWVLRKRIIMDALDAVRCPWRTMRPPAETVKELEAVKARITEWQREISNES